jgi:Na+/H+ antiporter NhaD/arsenite permease-like protein
VIVPAVSILAIAVAIAIGTLRRVNIGLVSMALAFAVGHFLAELPPRDTVAGWPLNLFLMLLGMTLLFGVARVNGTLRFLAVWVVRGTLGRTRLIPPAFFLMSAVLAASGAGNIVVCAVVLPIALTVATDRQISPLLMATMVIAGSNAGGLSPVAPTGIIANTLSADQGYFIATSIFYKQVIGQSILACILYFALRGHRLANTDPPARVARAEPFDRAQKATMAVVLLVVAGIVLFGWDIGLTAFAGTVTLLFLGAAEEGPTLQSVPWGTIILVCGVTVLVKVAESAGGIGLLAQQLTRLMDEGTAAPVMALIGGTLSLVSSASGVVLPTLIPAVPGLVAETGGDPARIISAIVMGAHMVTNSPISTLGALAMASAGSGVDRARLFNSLFLVGFAGLFYAAAIVYLGVV